MNTEMFEGFDNVQLHCKITKECNHNKWLIVTHGVGEYLERHDYIVDLFKDKYNILQYDLRGHGQSGGDPVNISDFNYFMHDLDKIIIGLKEKHAMENYTLFGHSMGALVTSSYIQNYAKENLYPEKVYINAPPVGVPAPLGPIIKFLPIKKLAGIGASIKLGGLVDLKYLSHDPSIMEKCLNDDRYSLKIHTKLLLSLVNSANDTYAKPLAPRCKMYCSVGSKDGIVCPKAVVEYFTNTEHRVDLKVFEGAFHEIHNEVDEFKTPYFEFLKTSLS